MVGGGLDAPVPRPPPVVVEAREAEAEREQVEEGVVAGEGDHDLQRREGQRSPMPESPWRGNEERRGQLDREHRRARAHLEPAGQLVRVPRKDGRQRLGLVVEAERGQVPPGGVPARELHEAGEEHEPEEKPPGKVARELGRVVVRLRPAQRPRDEEDAHQRAFEEERVPLEVVKDLAGRREGQRAYPHERQAEGGGVAQEHEGRQSDPDAAENLYEGARPEYPAERGDVIPCLAPDLLAGEREELPGGQNARRTDQPVRLEPE